MSPFADSIDGLKGDLFDVFVKPYFVGQSRPLKVGDIFVARGSMRAVEFKVISIEGNESEAEYCIVGADTDIVVEGEPLGRENDPRLDEIGYDDIGIME